MRVNPAASLQEYIDRLFKLNKIIKITDNVRIQDIPWIISRLNSSPVLLTNISGSKFSFASNLLLDESYLSIALGVKVDMVRKYVLERLLDPLKPEKLLRDLQGMKGPFTPKLTNLPIPKYYENDAGSYITSAVVLSKNPVDGSLNASIHRIRMLDDRHGAIRLVEGRHLHRAYLDAKKMGRDLEVVVLIGATPAIELAASYQAPYGIYEAWLANSLADGKLVFSLINGIPAPLNCEIILTARILSDSREEDRMVDMLGLYDKTREVPVIEFVSEYRRGEDVLFRGILPGGREHRFLMSFPIELKLERELARIVPGVKRVVLTVGGGNWLHAVIQISKKLDSDARQAIISAFTLHPSLKHVVVVDDDIDPRNPQEVEFAIATRFQATRDLIVLPKFRGSSLDPSSYNGKQNITDKLGIDATAPLAEKSLYRRANISKPASDIRILNAIINQALGSEKP